VKTEDDKTEGSGNEPMEVKPADDADNTTQRDSEVKEVGEETASPEMKQEEEAGAAPSQPDPSVSTEAESTPPTTAESTPAAAEVAAAPAEKPEQAAEVESPPTAEQESTSVSATSE